MIDPQQCVSQILSIDPDAAEYLFDLIIWIRQAEGALDQATLDEMESMAYAKTRDFEEQQKRYKETKLRPPSSRRRTQVAALPV